MFIPVGRHVFTKKMKTGRGGDMLPILPWIKTKMFLLDILILTTIVERHALNNPVSC
jgi:hypothetical protein